MDHEQFEALRLNLYNRSLAVVEEPQLEDLLAELRAQAADDLGYEFGDPEELDEATAMRLLASVEAWASIASHVTYHVYSGPLREVGAMTKRLAGWSKEVAGKLTELARQLGGYLEKAMRALGATSFSISVSFPWGISVGLSWG